MNFCASSKQESIKMLTPPHKFSSDNTISLYKSAPFPKKCQFWHGESSQLKQKPWKKIHIHSLQNWIQ